MSEPAQDILGIGGQPFELIVAIFRLGELHQLHLLELVLPDDAAHVAAIRAGLAAEAGRVGAEVNGQLVGIQRFVAKEIRDRNLRRGDQPVVGVLQLEKILRELRQLAGTVQACGIYHERRQHFGIAVLAGVRIEHEIDQRALQLARRARSRRQTCAR